MRLAAGEILFRHGDEGEGMYLLVDGRLDVRVPAAAGAEVRLDELGPGVSVGEMALLTGQRRVATVSALEPTRLLRLSRASLDRLAARHPTLLERLTEMLLPRFRRTQLAAGLAAWLGPLDPAVVGAIQAGAEWLRLPAGQTLFSEGEPGDAMYLVLDGRLGILAGAGSERERALGEVGRGEIVGELAVLTDEPRSATVLARRDTTLARIPRALVEQHPQVLGPVARAIARRVQRRASAARDTGALTAIALLPAGPGAPIHSLARRLAGALGGWGRVLGLDSGALDRAFGKPDAALAPEESGLGLSVTGWLGEQEAKHRFAVYVADPSDSAWTRRCLSRADRVLLVADATSDPAPGELEIRTLGGRDRAPVDLVLVQPPGIELPNGTLAWLSPRQVEHHHHIRLDRAADVGRLARRLTGRAVGIVLGGGGARGYVHVGLLRALEDLGIPVDAVGGASMGALVAGAYALSGTHRACRDAAATFGNRRRLIDYTLPLVALTKSSRVNAMFTSIFGEAQIEDLWTPFFCVSSNMTRAEPQVHERGAAWRAVRASSAIPGVFTPVLHDGDVLVDGGVMNNLPVDVMRDRIGASTVIASSASPRREKPTGFAFDDAVSGWRLLWSRLSPWSTSSDVPSIIDTLVGTTSVNSVYLAGVMAGLADLMLEYRTERFGNLEFGRYDEIIELGYQESRANLEAWLGTTAPAWAAHERAAVT